MWTLTAQLVSGTYVVQATDQIWWTSGVDNSAQNYVVVNSYQDKTLVYDSDGTTLQTGSPVHNTKYLSSSTVSLDGGGSVALSTLTNSNVSFKFTFDTSDLGGASVATSGAKFYAYDGTTDVNPMAGINFQAAIPGQSTWVAANGLNAALNLDPQSAATTHNFYIATSSSPTSTGVKSGKLKFSLAYV